MSDSAFPESPPVAPKNLSVQNTRQALAPDQAQEPILRKYIALHHYITVEASTEKMQAVFNTAMTRCQAFKCEILAANYSDDKILPPSANLSARLSPESVDAFIAGFDKGVEITQHQRTSEDKTDQVVDIEARIKNLTEFRDSLRELLKNKTAKFKDLIEVQRELANTQSEIDSMNTMRKILAKETELVALDITFVAKHGVTEHGFFAPVAEAFKQAGNILMTSVANIILLFVNAIPWILLAIPLVILARKRWAKIKAKQ
ncbi:MAG TPA: DUF4349 domain-containing protein [Methylotenera sp.]|nr:DUF4349 domain-containing protein [Methylotenera sp.]